MENISSVNIECRNLTKNFNDFVAVDQLTLKIHAGELYAFLGPNGAGKTTTIRMLSGLVKPNSGQIFICGENLAMNTAEIKKWTGYIPDQPYLYEKLTAREFIDIMGQLYGMDRTLIREESHRLFQEFDLIRVQNQLIESLSHGMKRRLIFALAVLHRPKILLIDEPMVGLDPKSTRKFKDKLKQLCQEGMTVFLSTHSLSVAEEISHRIGIIHHGRLIAEGTCQEIKEQSKSSGDLEDAFLAMTQEEDREGDSSV